MLSGCLATAPKSASSLTKSMLLMMMQEQERVVDLILKWNLDPKSEPTVEPKAEPMSRWRLLLPGRVLVEEVLLRQRLEI